VTRLGAWCLVRSAKGTRRSSEGGGRTHDLAVNSRSLLPTELPRNQSVRKVGFGPTAPASRTLCSTRLSYFLRRVESAWLDLNQRSPTSQIGG
jgi:hypothetical protein